MNNDGRKAIAMLSVVGVLVIGSGVNYVRVMRAERLKRRKIRAWEQERFNCTASSQARLVDVLEDPTKSWEDFWQAVREETAFLKIVRNQPMC